MTRQQKQFELAGIVRNRIVERQMLRPGDLLDHPGQWRDHTDAQAQAMAGILREVGIASTLKAWRSERAGGGLVTWDGHLRKSLDPDLEWPVDILDITDAEADYLLSVFDPVSAMATADAGALDALLSSVQSGEAAVTAMLAELAEGAGLYQPTDEKGNNYSRKIEAPIYTPKGDKPRLDDLYDTGKTQQLIRAINAAENISEGEREFLRAAAQRHTVLRFDRIADYYAHSGASMQTLMEDNALVIIDFDRAIELGFVQMSERLASIIDYEE